MKSGCFESLWRRYGASRKERVRERMQVRRFCRALAIIVIAFALLLTVSSHEARARDVHSSSVLDAWGQWGQSQGLLGAGMPEGFEQEAFSLADKQELRVDRDACVIGFSFRGTSNQALDLLRENLRETHWTETSNGSDGIASFSKTKGRYRWLFIQCVPMQEWTCVVVNYACQE